MNPISLWEQFTVLGAVLVTLSVIAGGVYKAWKEFIAWYADDRKGQQEERQYQRAWQEERDASWQDHLATQNTEWQKYIEEQRVSGEKLVAKSLMTLSTDMGRVGDEIKDNSETLRSNSRLLINLQAQFIEHNQMVSAVMPDIRDELKKKQ